jgi:uncharacterized protein with von Willebrand factor type A (vWA) domain
MTDADSGVTQVLPALAGFGRELRAAGLPVGTGQVLSFCQGLSRLDPTDLRDIYWSGRACLVSRRDDLAAYDHAFTNYFLGDAGARRVVPSDASPAVDPNEARPEALAATGGERRPDAESVGQAASEVEVLREKDFADCEPDELAAIGRLMAALVIAAPKRKTRRTERAKKGVRPDLRRALRSHVRQGGAGHGCERVRSSSCWTSRARCPPIRVRCSSSRTRSRGVRAASRSSASGRG